MDLTNVQGRVPYIQDDSTRAWAEQFRDENGLLNPQLVLRLATDSNWVHNMQKYLPAYSGVRHTRSIMNCGLPGTNIGGILNWQVDESHENEVASASFEIVNALPVSVVTTTLSAPLSGDYYSDTIVTSYVSDSVGVIETVSGNVNVETKFDFNGYRFRESNVEYRQFAYQQVSLTSATEFPDPGIPEDADNDIPDDDFWPKGGVGSYFILIGDEVVRVAKKSGGSLYIPAGGRALNGILRAHAAGEEVRLLGFGPFTGDYTGYGMFAVNDYKPYQSMFRTGTAITSYEGYGKIQGPLSHKFSYNRNYQFTGTWFVKNTEDSIDDNGIPRLKVTLDGVADLVSRQKITVDIVQRIKNKFDQWHISKNGTSLGAPVFGAAAHNREIPGDWVDYNSWDPTLKDSYPLKIKTEVAQHKEFFDHMADTEYGKRCIICRHELKAWMKRTGHKPTGAYANVAQRSVGRHVYKQSIRVQHPLQTYLRLMLTMCMAAWDHPPMGVDLAQKFTKIPNSLYNNIRNIGTGLVYNGQLDFELASNQKNFDWTKPAYDSMKIVSLRRDITCPFESSYDNVGFSQPLRDLAEANDMHFWINRRGYPVFLPKQFRLRPSGFGYEDLDQGTPYPKEGPGAQSVGGEWFLSYGGSITNYSHSINADSIITQCWVTGTTGFDSTFTVASAGTGFNNAGDKIVYGPVSGSKDGLMLTGGVQQLDTISMDSVILGLEWNVKPEAWGVTGETPGGDVKQIDSKPQLFDGVPQQSRDHTPKQNVNPNAIRRIQQLINFMLERRYIAPINHNNKWYYQIPEDGKFGDITHLGVIKVQNLVGVGDGKGSDGIYDRDLYNHVAEWFAHNNHYLKFDIWWYVQNGKTWEEYVAALTGVHVPLKASGEKGSKYVGEKAVTMPRWVINDRGLQKNIEVWQKKFVQDAINIGNRRVDDSINKAGQRTIQSAIADPRIQPGDIIWASIPGVATDTNLEGGRQAPFSNGIYLSSVSRQMDLQAGTYSATYTGYRYIANLGLGGKSGINGGYDFITNAKGSLVTGRG